MNHNGVLYWILYCISSQCSRRLTLHDSRAHFSDVFPNAHHGTAMLYVWIGWRKAGAKEPRTTVHACNTTRACCYYWSDIMSLLEAAWVELQSYSRHQLQSFRSQESYGTSAMASLLFISVSHFGRASFTTGTRHFIVRWGSWFINWQIEGAVETIFEGRGHNVTTQAVGHITPYRELNQYQSDNRSKCYWHGSYLAWMDCLLSYLSWFFIRYLHYVHTLIRYVWFEAPSTLGWILLRRPAPLSTGTYCGREAYL